MDRVDLVCITGDGACCDEQGGDVLDDGVDEEHRSHSNALDLSQYCELMDVLCIRRCRGSAGKMRLDKSVVLRKRSLDKLYG